MGSNPSEMQEPSIDTDKLSYEIFSILESKFLFGYDDQKLWIPKPIATAPTEAQPQAQSQPVAADNSVSAIKNQRGKICILSIDGAGMRGILSGKALAYLEHALKLKSGNPDARIADYFDVSAGSGVGGIFTAMLFATKDQSRPIFKAEDTWRFLAEQGKKFYRSSSGSSSNGGGGFFRRLIRGGSASPTAASTAGLEKAMKEAFTENNRTLTLKDTLKPVLIPCYDLSSTAPFLFSRADALETDSFDFRLWEVCRATSAEPSQFEPVQMRSIDGQSPCVAVDGGLAMSNPTAAAITHVLHNKQEFPFVRGVEDLLVLSIGTGQSLEVNYDCAEMALDHHDATNGSHSTAARGSEDATLSVAEIQDQMDQFTHIMQQKFLLGEDYEHLDYSKIDNDETLDDHWQREANHDAEEKYFGED